MINPIKIKNENKSLPDFKLKIVISYLKMWVLNIQSNKIKAIKNINLNIEGGSMAAFVGQSGAGKSTIILIFTEIL